MADIVTGASRDGHEYHEIWATRTALQLLVPSSELCGVAIEGISTADPNKYLPETDDIADLTLYFGSAPLFSQCCNCVISQFKYSVSRAHQGFRASDAKKTIQKFSIAYKDHLSKFKRNDVEEKLQFEIATNRPIYPELLHAIEGIAEGKKLSGNAKKQANQLRSAAKLNNRQIRDFCRKLTVIGKGDSIASSKHALSTQLSNWTGAGATDLLTKARLGDLLNLVRKKAGSDGAINNLLLKEDVLTALGITDADELLPCPDALIEVSNVLLREQYDEVIQEIESCSRPILIHAAGGIGKTVFLQSIANRLSSSRECVIFDCFGGGGYRSPEDSRHQARKAFVHIANTLAYKGLCDLLLPGNQDISSLVRAFRKRLEHSVETLNEITGGGDLVLLLDAIDNAFIAATLRDEECFSDLLIESLTINPIQGIKLVCTCRTERLPALHEKMQKIKLSAFSQEEAACFLRSRVKDVSDLEISAAFSRSNGNPRVLEYLVGSEKSLLESSEVEESIELNDLIDERVEQSLTQASMKGYSDAEIGIFLAGLAILPPPVPLAEYAKACGMEVSAIESFASDLRPLLERTSQGLMFRDEPTETYIHDKYATDSLYLEALASNLMAMQEQSVYAAHSLPNLLYKTNNGSSLYALAFDSRIPSSISSGIGVRNIRLARLNSAVRYASKMEDYDSLIKLIVEMAQLSSEEKRGAEYLFRNPSLAVLQGDSEAIRRICESKFGWPGSRSARMTILNSLSGGLDEAARYASSLGDWLNHYYSLDKTDNFRQPDHPDLIDTIAIPLFLSLKKNFKQADRYINRYYPWYAYQLVSELICSIEVATKIGTADENLIRNLIRSFTSPGSIVAALVQAKNTPQLDMALLEKLATLCRKKVRFKFDRGYGADEKDSFMGGFLLAAGISLYRKRVDVAQTIIGKVSFGRPELWIYRSHYNRDELFSYILFITINSIAKNRDIGPKDLLPREIYAICSRLHDRNDLKSFQMRAISKIRLSRKSDDQGSDIELLSYDDKNRAERFISSQLGKLLDLVGAFRDVLNSRKKRTGKQLKNLISIWLKARKSRDYYDYDDYGLFHFLGLDLILYAFKVRKDVGENSVKEFISSIEEGEITLPTWYLIELVQIFSKRESLQFVAGSLSQEISELIGTEDDIELRASQFSRLSNAIITASGDEAIEYFQRGLDQLDAIGSGEYKFTRELLNYASRMDSQELEEKDFHTVTNLCELNFTDEPSKFYWGGFGKALSRSSGIRGLAKLSRWDDRELVDFEYSLLPYIVALVEDNKLPLDLAIALNYLASPAELWECGSEELVNAFANSNQLTVDLFEDLLSQYQRENRANYQKGVINALEKVARKFYSSNSPNIRWLKKIDSERRLRKAHDNANQNQSGAEQSLLSDDHDEVSSCELFSKVLSEVSYLDSESLARSFKEIGSPSYSYKIRPFYIEKLVDSVKYSDQAKFIETVVESSISLYSKEEIFDRVGERWPSASLSVKCALTDAARKLVKAHIQDLIEFESFSWRLDSLSKSTGTDVSDVAMEVIKALPETKAAISGDDWLALAGCLANRAKTGVSQEALSRLLNSPSSRLADSVVDGQWRNGLYPASDLSEVVSGMIWRSLGSPIAERRWRAAHSFCYLCRKGRWEIVNRIVKNLSLNGAGAFQASELPFYYLHARLWLLIALARVSIDYPAEISRYKKELFGFIDGNQKPHALCTHFAALALSNLIQNGNVRISKKLRDLVLNAGKSQNPPKEANNSHRADSYGGRPASAPSPQNEFHLEYDFRKLHVDGLARVFDKSCWEVEDLMSEHVYALDSQVDSMFDPGGRDRGGQDGSGNPNSLIHRYGEYLGVHGLFFAASELLATEPVAKDRWHELDSWLYWFEDYSLSVRDGYWLSDCVDLCPQETLRQLSSRNGKDSELTGDKSKLLYLVGIDQSIGDQLVIDGSWKTSDGISVRISSALVKPSKAVSIAKNLLAEKPIHAWIPSWDESEHEFRNGRPDERGFIPWIERENRSNGIDQNDPLGSYNAFPRAHISPHLSEKMNINRGDPIGRVWKAKGGKIVIRSLSWGESESLRVRDPSSGNQLLIDSSFLKNILSLESRELLLLIKLERYESGNRIDNSKYQHTIGVLRIKRDLNYVFYPGAINQQFQHERW